MKIKLNSLFNKSELPKPLMFGVVTSPITQFKRMKYQTPILIPVIIMLFLTVVTSAMLSYVTLNNPMIESIYGDKNKEILMKMAFLSSFSFSAIGGIITLFLSPIFYKNIMIFFGIDISYKKILCLVLYTTFIIKLGMILNGTIAIILKSYELSYTSLAPLIIDNLILHSMAQRVDIFNIWYFILLGAGIHIVTNLSRNKTIILMIIMFLFTTFTASIAGVMQGISTIQH
ncbi:Yip1 family protein [Bacillus sp. MMSF_3353]|uniref:Yip1 family protein n=1 Tax=Bacillus sp. MMSF_3353 TaxID=3047081 RepID=UPI00273DFCD3|nr:Yip1 family protein [Bacillus sp. MMSF_3353]